MQSIRRWLRRHKKVRFWGGTIMAIFGIYSIFSGEPISDLLKEPFFNNNICAYILKLAGFAFIAGAVCFYRYVTALPADNVVKYKSGLARKLKGSIWRLTKLYNSFVKTALKYKTADYAPLLETDILYKNQLNAHHDQRVAIQYCLAYSNRNPVIDNLKTSTPEWSDLIIKIDELRNNIADSKLGQKIDHYKSELEGIGIKQIKFNIITFEHPSINHSQRILADIHIEDLISNFKNVTQVDLIKYIDQIIDEY